ncbi:MAG: metallophosphoesterase [Candidatus Methylacidiphilales bacterium]|nr:metallophosphoesterase [Candidatus Methylacidiphilales bacterium]
MTTPPGRLPEPYQSLADRIGTDRLRHRLWLQASHWARLQHQGEGLFQLEKFLPVDSLVRWGLRMTGLAASARNNFLAVHCVEQSWHLPRLPQHLDGLRILQLSDLHLDLDPALTPVLMEILRKTPHDIAVVTGDYRNSTDQDPSACMEEMKQIIPLLAPRRYGILGNHDFIEMVPVLEDAGLPILLNAGTVIPGTHGDLAVAGVDDPHFYQTHDFNKSRSNIPDGVCTLLLCHSPEEAEEASLHPFDLMLCGHTHGGQLCLPGGRPLVCPVRRDMPLSRIHGRWQCGNLPGYTSAGTGSCGVAARLNCPPEITLHVLHHG